MAEAGIGITQEFPRPWTEEVVCAADVVTMGCGDACPLYPGKRYEDWELDDPSDRTSTKPHDDSDTSSKHSSPLTSAPSTTKNTPPTNASTRFSKSHRICFRRTAGWHENEQCASRSQSSRPRSRISTSPGSIRSVMGTALYAHAAHEAPDLAEREHQTRQAARVNALLRDR